MSESAATPTVTVHVLRPAPPVRAFLIAAVAAVCGAVLLVAGVQYHWPTVVGVLGGVLIALGLALLVLALFALLRMRVRGELTPTGYTFRTPAGVRQGTWAETVKVTVSDTGRRVSLIHRDETVDHVLTPLGNADPALDELLADVYRHLEVSRRA